MQFCCHCGDTQLTITRELAFKKKILFILVPNCRCQRVGCAGAGSCCIWFWFCAQGHPESRGPSGGGKSIVWNIDLSFMGCFLGWAFLLTFLHVVLTQRKCFNVVCGFWESELWLVCWFCMRMYKCEHSQEHKP